VVKSLIHANRLKLYVSPELRPTNPPPQLLYDQQVTNSEFIADSDSIPSQSLDNTGEDPNEVKNASNESNDPPAEPVNGDVWLTVDKILCCKPSNKVKWYCVKWVEQKESTWVKEEFLPQHLI